MIPSSEGGKDPGTMSTNKLRLENHSASSFFTIVELILQEQMTPTGVILILVTHHLSRLSSVLHYHQSGC